MQTFLTRCLSTAGLSACLILGFHMQVQTQTAQPACTGEEGTAIKTSLDLEFCSGTSQARVATFDTPQPGARVLAAVESGIAHRAGLRAGDIVYQVAGRRVQSGKAAADALANPGATGPLLINFWRDGRTYLVRIWVGSK